AAGSEPVPPALDRVVRRCLQRDPKERFQSARDLAFGLEVASNPSGAAILPVAEPSRPRRGLPLVAAMVALLGVTTGAFFCGTRRGTAPLAGYKQLTFERGMLLNARFTADGTSVVYSALWDGNPAATFSMRLDRPEAPRVDLPPARLVGVSRRGELAVVL